jgi:hypothetical protein
LHRLPAEAKKGQLVVALLEIKEGGRVKPVGVRSAP